MLVPLPHSRVFRFAWKLRGSLLIRTKCPDIYQSIIALCPACSGDHPTGTSTDCCFYFSIIFLERSLQNWDAIHVMAPVLLYFFLVISCFTKSPTSSLSPCVQQGAHGHPSHRRPPKSFAQPLISQKSPVRQAIVTWNPVLRYC